MKKVFITLLLLFIPFIVKAELKELRLIDQYNTGYRDIYYMGDYFLLMNDVYEENKDYAFAAMDINGNYLYEHENINGSRKLLFDYEYVYVLYVININGIKHLYLEKYNPKTGELLSDIVIENVEYYAWDYNIYPYEGYIGIKSPNYNKNNYIIPNDFSSYQPVTNFNGYTERIIENPYHNYISESDNNRLYDYLENNHIELDTLSGKSILVGNYYYTYTKGNKEIKPNLIMIDKDYEDYELKSILNKDFYDGSKVEEDRLEVTDLYEYDGKVIAVLEYNGMCITAQNASERYGDGCTTNTYIQIYKPIYNVYTKTDGNGEVKASQNTADTGEGITFEVIPNKGYVLSEVKVTDSEGNVVTFTDYKFTMPSSDVTIEAVFVPENPNTKSFIGYIAIILIISILSITISINEIKREKELKI